MAAMCDYFFDIEVHQGAITVSSSDPKFCATYYTHSDKAHLCLRHRTYTEDRELLAQAFQAAVSEARELRWIARRKKPGCEEAAPGFPQRCLRWWSASRKASGTPPAKSTHQ
jgi:hypothetical protein